MNRINNTLRMCMEKAMDQVKAIKYLIWEDIEV